MKEGNGGVKEGRKELGFRFSLVFGVYDSENKTPCPAMYEFYKIINPVELFID